MTKLMRRFQRNQEKVVKKINRKNRFNLDPLEPRLLLSGDPVTVDIAKTLQDNTVYESSTLKQTQTPQETNIIDVAAFTFEDAIFTVDQNTILKGSGTLDLDLVNNNIVAPGYSPGVQNIMGDYTQSNNAILQIELGGTTAGTGTGFYDQLNISGMANFAGTLEVSLWNNFKPQIGDTFDIITFDSANGLFTNLTGFYGFESDYYFELVQTNNKIQLVTKEIIAGNDYSFISSDLEAKNDSLGMLLNDDYLGANAPTSVTLSGNINLGSNLNLSGEITYSLDTNSTLLLNDTTSIDVTTTTISGTNLTAFFGVEDANGDFGLTFSDADFSIAMFDSVLDDNTWLVSQGTLDGETFLNLDDLDFTSGNMSFYVNQAFGDTNAAVADLTNLIVNSQTYIDDGSEGEQLYLLAQNLSMSLDSSIAISADNLLFGASSSSFYALSDSLSASMNTGAFSISVSNSSFGMLATTDGLVLKADGDFSLSGGGFTNVSATSSSLIFNNTNTAYNNYALNISSNSYTLNNIEASSTLSKISVIGLSATIDDMFSFSGDVDFSKNGSIIDFLSSNASVALFAGNSSIGAKNANVGFSINNDNKRVLEARGDFNASLNSDINLSAASSIVSFKDDGYSLDNTNQTVDIGNSSFTFSNSLLGTTAISEVSVLDAGLEVDEFFYAKGDFSFSRTTNTLKDVNNADVQVDILSMSASNLEAFAGLNANTVDATGLALVGANFALSIANERTTNTNKRVWTSLSASSQNSTQLGFDGLNISGSNLSVDINLSSEAPLTSSATLSGTFGIEVDGFTNFSGDLEFAKSNETFILDDGSSVDAQILSLSATNTSAFIGLGDMGLDVSGMDLGLVYAVDSTNPLRDWMSVKALANTSTFTGPFDATLQNDDITLEINQQSYDERVIDFNAKNYKLTTNTDVTITFDINGDEGAVTRAKIEQATLNVDDFLIIEGPLYLSKGKTITADVYTGDLENLVNTVDGMGALSTWNSEVINDVELESLQIGGSGLTGFAGDQDGLGVQLSDVDFALSMMKIVISVDNSLDFSEPISTELPIKFISAKADVGTASLVGVDPNILDLDLNDVQINVNTSHVKGLTAQAAALLRLPYVDLSNNVQNVPIMKTVNGVEQYISLDQSQEIIQAKFGFAQGSIANSIEVAGSFALTKIGTQTVTLSDGSTTEVMSLSLGGTGIYGFFGYSETGYLKDSNNDGIIDSNDTFNSGVGLEISDMDLGAVFMRSAQVDLNNPLTYYTAVASHINSATLVGAGDNVTFEAKDLNYFSNKTSSSLAVDFSKSGLNGAAYEIATGKVVSGVEQFITLDMSNVIEKVKGSAKLEVVGMLAVDGVFDFEMTNIGLTAFFDGDATVGTYSTIKFTSHASGLLVVANGGIASRLKFDNNIDLGAALQSNVKFDLILNTLTSLNTDISYAIPDEFKSLVSYSTFTVPLIPPSEDSKIGDYIYLSGTGDITFLDSLNLDGDFSIVMSTTKAELNIDASASVEALATVDAVGTLGFEDGGVYGSLTFGSAGGTLINASAFSLAGTYLLQINTTSKKQNVKAVNIVDGTIDSTTPYTTTDINSNEIHVAGYSELSLSGAKLSGFMDMSVSTSGIDSTVDMVMKLGSLGNIAVKGDASIGLEGSESYFAMSTNVDSTLGIDIISISANGLLQINTGSQSHAGVAGGQLFKLGLDGSMDILGFNGIALKGDVTIEDSLFKITIDKASLDFFGFVTFDMSGYIQSDGKYSITGEVSQDIDLSVIVLKSKMSLTVADTGFEFYASGSVDIHLDFGLFEVNKTLTAVEGKGAVYASSAELSVKLTFMGIDFSSSVSWSLGAPPVIASQVGDTVYLNMGQRGQDYRGDLYKKIINESYNIKEDASGNIIVSSLGQTSTFSGVKKIVANGGDGNDMIIVDPSVGDDVVLEFDGESGDDGFFIGNGAATSVIIGGLGDDIFTSNAKSNGITYYGNEGNDEFIGSDANEFIYMGDGQNKITASGGNDTIEVRGIDNVNGGLGNDLITIFTGATVHGGGGSDNIIIDSTSVNAKVYGDDGDDRITSNGTNASVDGGSGNDTIYSYMDDLVHGGSGNDTIYIYNASEIYGDSGDDTFIIDSLETAFTTAIFGGSGNDTMELGTITSSSALKFGINKFAYDQRVIDFDGTLERINLVDNAVNTIIQNYSASSTYNWADTSFALRSSGSIDVSAVTLNHKNALLSYKSTSIIGILNTDVRDIAIVTGGDITINEKDSLNITADNLANGGVYTNSGKIDITLNAKDSLLRLLDGILSTANSSENISITADDIDFNSGRDMVVGSGALIIQAKSVNQNYKIGMAGSDRYGYDYSNDGANGYMEFTLKDFDALSSNFATISIGHNASDVVMYIADVEDKTLDTGVNYSAKLNSETTLISNKIVVRGDVQSSKDLTLNADLLEVLRTNMHDPMGIPDSGLSAQNIYLNINEQIAHSGWLKAKDKIEVNVLNSTGINAFVTYSAIPNSFSGDTGSSIIVENANGEILFNTSGSIYSASYLETQGSNSTITLITSTGGITLLEGGTIAAKKVDSDIVFNSASSLNLNSGAAIMAGADFDYSTGTPVAYKTAENGNITINAAGELGLAGSLTASGDIVLNATASTSDHADYFDTINGKTLATTDSSVAQIMAGLENGSIDINLKNLFANNNLTLGSNATVTNVSGYVPFTSLTDEQKALVAQSLGYSIVGGEDKTFYYNADTDTIRTTFTQGYITQDSTGYIKYSGQFYYDSVNKEVVKSFTQTIEGDYVLDEIDWGSVTKPASGTLFDDMTQEQKDILVAAIGYTYDTELEKYYNYNASTDKKILTTFIEGIAGDYSYSDITWLEGDEPSPTAKFESLSNEQKALVATTLGYEVYSDMYYNENAEVKFVKGFGSADYENALIEWGSANVPAANTSFNSLSNEQKAVVLSSLGYTQYTGTYYYNSDADVNKKLVNSFIADADYDSSIIELNTNQKILRYIVTDGDNTYIVYGRDGDADGIANNIDIQSPHELLGQRGYGFMLTGTMTSLKDNADIVISSQKDVIIRGNFNILGENSNLTVQSSTWTYWEGNANVTGDISIYGGVNLDGTISETALERSLYTHYTSTLVSKNADATITLKAGKDADLSGAIIAGVEYTNGVPTYHANGVVNISAGEQIYLDAPVTASKEINISTSNLTSVEDNGYSLIITTSSSLTAGAFSSDNSGGNINIDTIGSVTLMGDITAGAKLTALNSGGYSYDWIAQHSEVIVRSGGQIYVGGITTTQDGKEVEVGGSIYANHSITLESGIGTDDIGIHLPGAGNLVTHDLNGTISLNAIGNALIYGKIISGGEIIDSYDLAGEYIGSTTNTFGGNSSISITAQKQIVLTQDLYAGKNITVSGGYGSDVLGESYTSYGAVVGGTVHLKTWMKNSTINISSLGDTMISAPAWTQELVASDFTQYASGKISSDVTLNLQVDLGTHVVQGLVTLKASDTTDNTLIQDLVADLQNAINNTSFKVISSPSGEPSVGSSKNINQNTDYPEVKVRLLNGKLMLSGNYETTLLTEGSINANIIGFTQATTTNTTSSRSYTIDAAQSGSVVNIGNITGNSGEIYIAGNIRAHSAINLYSGTNDDGSQNFTLGATGVLETLSGSIELNPGDYGVLTGSIIARGETSDIILNSKYSLDIVGSLTAGRDIKISAGSIVEEGNTSITTYGTSKLISLSNEGTISISGLNDVVINSTIGGDDSANLKLIELSSLNGKLTLDKTSGRINTGASLILSGQSVDLAGVITSTRATESLSDYEVSIKTSGDVSLHGSIDLAGSFLVDTKGNIYIYNTNITAKDNQRLTFKAGKDFLIGTVNPVEGVQSVNAVTISADKTLSIKAGNLLYIGTDAILETTQSSSSINIESNGIVLGGTIQALADNSNINITAYEYLSIGAQGLDEFLTLVNMGGNILASGDITLQLGANSDGLALVLSSLSSIKSLNGDILINAVGEIQNNGIIQTLGENSEIIINSNSLIYSSNLIKAYNSVTLSAGIHESTLGIYLDDTSVTSTILESGTISLTSIDSIYSSGVLGESQIVDSNLVATVSTIELVSLKGNITVNGSIDAKDSISLKALNVNVLYPGRLYTTNDASTIRVNATEQVFVDVGALVSSVGLTHLYGNNLKLSGNIESRGTNSKIYTSSKSTTTIKGSLEADDIIIYSGIKSTWSMNDIENSDVKVSNDYLSTLGTLDILEKAIVTATNDITINTGGTVNLSASASAGDEVTITLPIIQSKTVEVEVVTGYTQVDGGTINVPVISFEESIYTEQIGLEKVADGSEYFTMTATLEQTGYYNKVTNSFKEYFIEGIDYFNESLWPSDVSLGKISGDYTNDSYKTWGELSNTQKQDVLKYLGYKELYQFSATNFTKWVKGVPYENTSERPDWYYNAQTIENIDVEGWKDKFIRLPIGAQLDISNIVFKGTTQYLTGDDYANGVNNGSWVTNPLGATGEFVGTYHDSADLLYTQISSTYTGERLFSNTSETFNYVDIDGKEANWKVTYSDSGIRYFNIAGQTTKSMYYVPDLGLTGQTTWDSSVYGNYDAAYQLSRATDNLSASSTFINTLIYNTASLTLDATTTHSDVAVGSYDYHYLVSAARQAYFNLNKDTDQGGDWKGVYSYADGTTRVYDLEGTDWQNEIGYWRNEWGVGYIEFYYNGGTWSTDLQNDKADRVRVTGAPAVYSNGTTTITENQYDYEYSWTGSNENIYDQRKKMSYDLTTFGNQLYTNTPIYETKTELVEVVQSDTQTVWDTVAQTATQEESYNQRTELDAGTKTSSEFASKTLSATNITINSNKNVDLSSWLESTNDLTINADGSIKVEGIVASGADLASSSILKAGNSLVLNSGENTTLASSAVLEANEISLTALDSAIINGQITSTTSFTANITNNVNLEATINAQSVNVNAGGSFNASLYTNISASDFISLSSDKNMSLSDASLNAINNTITLISTGGSISHSGELNAISLTAYAKNSITANASVTNTTLATTAKGDINLTSTKDIEITHATTTNGNINITSFGQVRLKDVKTLGVTESNDLNVTTYVGDIVVENIALGTLGDVNLNSVNAIDFANAVIVADELILNAKNSIVLQNKTSVNSLSITTRESGNVSFAQSTSKALILKDIKVAKGTLDITNDTSITVTSAQILANEDASDINIASTTGNITLGYLSAGRYASTQSEFNSFGLGDATTVTSMGDITLSAVAGNVSSLETNSVNLVADELNITALNGIETIASVNKLTNITSTSGNITITDKNGIGEISKVLTIGNISTAKANQDTITLETTNTIKVDENSTLSGDIIRLVSAQDDVIVVKPTEGSVNMDYSYGVGLSAVNGSVLAYQFFDASGYLEYRAGDLFQFGYEGSAAYTRVNETETITVDFSQMLPTTLSADTIIIQTGATYTLGENDTLSVKDRLELISSNGSVVVNGNINILPSDANGRVDNFVIDAKDNIYLTNMDVNADNYELNAGNDIYFYSSESIILKGDINAGNNITFVTKNADKYFYMNSANVTALGDVSIDSDKYIYVSNNSMISAVNLSANASTYITLYTMVDTLTLDSTALGNVYVSEADEITLESIMANNGDITIISGGDMIAKDVQISLDSYGSNANNISLKSYGNNLKVGYIETATVDYENKKYGTVILESAKYISDYTVDSVTDIYTKAVTIKGTAQNLEIKYGVLGSKYTNSATTITPVDISNFTPTTPSYTLSKFPTGQEDKDVTLSVNEDLTVNVDITGTKDATFIAGENLVINNPINTTGDVVLSGKTLDVKDEIIAGSLSVTGGTIDITTQTPLINLIDTSAGSGDINLSNTGDLAITEIKLPSLGTPIVDITGTGNITIDKISGSAEIINITTTGDVIIKDIADVSKLNIITDGQIILGTPTSTINADELNLEVSGDVVIYEADDVIIKNITQNNTNSKVEIHTGGKLVLEDDILITGSNNAILESGDDIVIKGNITVGSGDVVISTDGKLSFENDDEYDIVATNSKVTLDVAGNISDSEGFAIDIDVAELDITSGSGDISINEKDDLILSVSDTSGDVNIKTGGKIDITQITGSNDGNINIVSDDISVNGKIQTANGDVILISTNDIILHSSIYTSGTGNIELTATKGKIANETNDANTTAIDTNITVLNDVKLANYSDASITNAETTLVNSGIILSSTSGEIILKAYNEIGSNLSKEGTIIIDATAISAISNNKNDVSITALKEVQVKQIKGDDGETTSITIKTLSGAQTISENIDAKGGDITIIGNDVNITSTIKSNGGNLVFAPTDSNANLMLGTSISQEVTQNDMYIDQGEIEKIEQISSITFGQEGGSYLVKMGDSDDTQNTDILFNAPIIIINNGENGHTIVSDNIISSSSFTGYGSGHTTVFGANQTYGADYYLSDSIQVAGNQTLTVTNGNITIDDTLAIQTAINGDGLVGDDILTLNAQNGDVIINAVIGGNPTDGTTIFNETDILEGLNVSGENITFNESVTLNGDFIINATGTVIFEKDVVISGGDLSILGATNVIFKGNVTVTGGDITLEADEIDIENSFGGNGALTFKTVSDNLSINIGTTTTSASLDLTQTELSHLSDGFSKIVFGKVDSGHSEITNNNIEISAFNFLDSVEFYGNNITVNETLNSTGNITFDAVDSVSIDANTSATGDMSIYTKNGSVTQESSSLSATNLTITSNDGIVMSNVDVDTIDIDATKGTVDINFISDVIVKNITNDADILLTSSGSMTLTENITSSSEVNINIDGNFSMNDGVVLTTSGSEGFTTIDANGNIALSKLVSNNLTKVISNNGSISDNLTTGNNVETTSLVLKSANGIDLDTSVDTIKISNSTSGKVTINEANNISIDTSILNGNSQEFSLTTSGNIDIINSLTNNGTIGGYIFNANSVTVNGAVYTKNGDITITANEYTQNKDVSTDNGDITLTIENNVYQNADLLATNGDITVSSNSGDIIMGDGSVTRLSNYSGIINYNSSKDIYLSQLTTNGEISFVLNGFIHDISSNEEANIQVKNLNVTTQTGFGTSSEDIDLDVETVTIINTTSGGIYIDEKDDLNIKILTAVNQNIYVNAGGSITDGTSNESANIISDTLTIIANNTIGTTSNDLDLSVNTLTNANANGIYLSNDKSLNVQTIEAYSTINLNVNGSISDTLVSEDANIKANELILTTQTGFGTSSEDIDLDVETVTITNTISGGIYIDEKDDLNIKTLTAINQNIYVNAGGSITDGTSNESANIISDTLTIIANNTIGTTSNDLDLSVNTLTNANANGIYLSNDKSLNVISAISRDNVEITVLNGNLNLGNITASGKTVTLNSINGSITDISVDESANIIANTANLNAKNNVGGANGADIDLDVTTLNGSIQNATSFVVEDIDSLGVGIINAAKGEVTIVVSPNGNFYDANMDRLVNITATHLRLIGHGISVDDNGIFEPVIETVTKTISMGSYVTDDAKAKLTITNVVQGRLVEGEDVWTQFINLGVFVPITTLVSPYASNAYPVGDIQLIYTDYEMLRYLMQRTYYMVTHQSLASTISSSSLNISLPMIEEDILNISNSLYDTFISLGGNKLIENIDEDEEEINLLDSYLYEVKQINDFSLIPQFGGLTFDQSIIQENEISIPFEYWIENIAI